MANLQPRGIDYEILESTCTFTGISGQPDPSAGSTYMPCGLDGLGLAYWYTNLMGSSGSLCPALLANDTLVRLKGTIVGDCFPDHSGILGLQLVPDRWFFFRIFLSDSGHWLLPFDRFDCKPFDTQRHLQHLFLKQMRRMTVGAGNHSALDRRTPALTLSASSDHAPGDALFGSGCSEPKPELKLRVSKPEIQTQSATRREMRHAKRDRRMLS